MDLRKMLFWRKPPIADPDALATFIDERAAFLVQKGIYEYSRARAGHYAKVMFSERTFLDAVERSRWSSYPIGLAMVGEVAEGILRPHAGPDHARQRERLNALVLDIFDSYERPEVITATAWSNARQELARRLDLVGLHPPKRVMDVPEPYTKIYFNLMPIHPDLRATDYGTTRNYLRIVLCNVHDELETRMDAAAVSRMLLSDQAESAEPEMH